MEKKPENKTDQEATTVSGHLKRGVIKPCSCGRKPYRCLNAEGTLGRLYCDYCCRAAWEFKPTFTTMEEMINDWNERAL